MKEFVEQIRDPEPEQKPRVFELGDLSVFFRHDGSVSMYKGRFWEPFFMREVTLSGEEMEAFLKLAQTMPFPVDDAKERK